MSLSALADWPVPDAESESSLVPTIPPPTTQATAAADEYQRTFVTLSQRWREIKTKDAPALNEQLKQANLPPLT